LSNDEKPIADPLLVFRGELDNWGILYDPDTGNAFGLDPVSAFIWRRLDGKHSINDIVAELHENCSDMPDNANSFIESFIQDLGKQGLAGYEAKP